MSFRYVAIMLCAVCVIVFIIQNSVQGFTESLLLTKDVLSRPWILVTSIFLHGSMSHLLGNIFALGLFGSILERIVGWRKFVAVFFAAGIVSGLASAFFYDAALGASGAIFGALGMLAALRPKMMVWTYGVPMPMFIAAGFWLVLDIAGTFYPTSVANIAHIVGLAFGIAVGLIFRQSADEKRSKPLTDEEVDKWEDQWMT